MRAFAPPHAIAEGVTLLSALLLAASGLTLTRGLQRLYQSAYDLPSLGVRGTPWGALWLLLIPALQRRILAKLLRSFGDVRRNAAPVVELDPDEWQRVAEEDGSKDPKQASAAHSCRPAPAVLATPPERGSSASRVKEEQ